MHHYKLSRDLKRQLPLHLMLIPGIVLVFCFSYIPIFGNVIAFQNYDVFDGILHSTWAGLANFKLVFGMPDFIRSIWNTLYISILKIILSIGVPLIIALLLNEISGKWFNRVVQTSIYLPYFMSWIILGGVFLDLLSLHGLVNQFIGLFGIKAIYFLGDNHWFVSVLVATDTWKGMGFNTIIFLAAIVGIDPSLYEAVSVDGGNRMSKTFHVTMPGMKAIIILVCTLSLGQILNAGFEQVLTLYGPQVYQTGDIVDTFVYRLGLVQDQFSPAAAVGLFKSAISCFLISISYYLAYLFADYRIF